MPTPNALADLCELALEARANRGLWKSKHTVDSTWGWDGTRSAWREMESRQIGEEVARISMLCRPLHQHSPGRPRQYVVIELKLTIAGSLKLVFRPVDEPRRSVGRMGSLGGKVKRASLREHRQRLRSVYRRYGEPFSVVPLVWDDSELQALLALRCEQQEYESRPAREALISYARRLGVPNVGASGAENVMNDVLSRLAQNFVSGPAGALGSYIRALKNIVFAESARERSLTIPTEQDAEQDDVDSRHRWKASRSRRDGRELLSAYEAVSALKLSLRTLYRRLRGGSLKCAARSPYRFTREEIEVARRKLERIVKPGVIYKCVMKPTGRTYDAARMYVGRRRAKGLTDLDIVREVLAKGGS